MKPIISVLALVLLLAVFAARAQTASPETAPQASRNSPHSSSNKAFSHDHHVHAHRAGNHHRRPRVTAKSHHP